MRFSGKPEAMRLCGGEAARTFLNSVVPRKNHEAGSKITRLFPAIVNGSSFILAFWQVKPFRDFSVKIFQAFSLHAAGLETLVLELVRENETLL